MCGSTACNKNWRIRLRNDARNRKLQQRLGNDDIGESLQLVLNSMRWKLPFVEINETTVTRRRPYNTDTVDYPLDDKFYSAIGHNKKSAEDSIKGYMIQLQKKPSKKEDLLTLKKLETLNIDNVFIFSNTYSPTLGIRSDISRLYMGQRTDILRVEVIISGVNPHSLWQSTRTHELAWSTQVGSPVIIRAMWNIWPRTETIEKLVGPVVFVEPERNKPEEPFWVDSFLEREYGENTTIKTKAHREIMENINVARQRQGYGWKPIFECEWGDRPSGRYQMNNEETCI